MTKIIENQGFLFNAINISQNESVIDYLKSTNNGFVLKHVDHRIFDAMQVNRFTSNSFLSFISNNIAEYSKYYIEENSIASLLKIEDNEKIFGSFVIEEDKVIYSPYSLAIKHDRLAYSQICYYTTMSMYELLIDTFRTKDYIEYLLFAGATTNSKDIFQTSSKEEILDYATNREKGVELIKNIQSKRPIF